MEKDKVVRRLHRQIDRASRRIDDLKLQTHLAKADAKAAFVERVESLEKKRNDLRDSIHHLQYNTTSAWEDLAEGCKKSWTELKTSLRNAIAEYRSE
ncbi:MAG: hypothetical protein CMO55_03350 [Verrucomicrobiales bacterium]|nr:hypothetical protein [Verrucomicrobiales bacterium]